MINDYVVKDTIEGNYIFSILLVFGATILGLQDISPSTWWPTKDLWLIGWMKTCPSGANNVVPNQLIN